MIKRTLQLITAAVAGLLAAGCANDGSPLMGSNLTTSSIAPAAGPKVDPACVALTARIDALRKEGFVEGVEKASTGKTTSVTVKRASLAKMTELDKANAEFQAKCATISPAAASSAQTAAATVAPVKPAAPAPAAKTASAAPATPAATANP